MAPWPPSGIAHKSIHIWGITHCGIDQGGMSQRMSLRYTHGRYAMKQDRGPFAWWCAIPAQDTAWGDIHVWYAANVAHVWACYTLFSGMAGGSSGDMVVCRGGIVWQEGGGILRWDMAETYLADSWQQKAGNPQGLPAILHRTMLTKYTCYLEND